MSKTVEDGRDAKKRLGLFSGFGSRGEVRQKESPFEITIEELPKKFHPAVISRMQILNLASLIVRRDVDMIETIKAAEVIALGVIEDNLREKDAYVHNDVGVYGFLFPGVSKKAAELKRQVIADQIARLIGDADPKSLNLEFEAKTRKRRSGSFIAAIAGQKMKPAARVGKKPDPRQLQELEVKKAQANLAVQQMANKLRREGPDLKAGQADWWIEENDARADKKYLPEGIATIYRAMWNVNNKLLTAYSALPVIKSPEGRVESIIRVGGDSNMYAVAAACDRLIQEEALTKLHLLLAAGHKVLLVLPVHFSTVHHHDYFMAYQQRLRALDEKRRKLVVQELVNVPPDLKGDRIRETVTRLRQVARSVMARVPASSSGLRPWRDAGVHAVGFDAAENQSAERVLLKQLGDFAGHAEEMGLKKFVYGLTARSAASAAVAAGFDYIEGNVVRPPVDSPTYVEPFESLDLFSGLFRR